jgi:hypothetical protein
MRNGMSFLTMGLIRKMIPNIKNETEGDGINEGNYLRQCTSWQY